MSSARPRADRTLPSLEDTTLENALTLIDRKYIALEKTRIEIQGQKQFGQLFTFAKEEIEQLTAIRELVVRYVGRRSPPRPLCLAVFGPPGSGKSFAVKQIVAEAQRVGDAEAQRVGDPRQKLPLTIVNLTQVSDPGDLGRVLARIAGEQDEDTVPIVFFDEFDAPRGSASYGWLQWFLAPMHDGEFLHEDAVIRLKRAVYVFAGGTAATMNEFSHLHTVPAFHSAKGPDFISRLRGFLDVQGPNAEPRVLRRALLFRKELQDRADSGKEGTFRPDRQLLEALLQVGRYRHGARSVGAVIELSDVNTKKGRFGWDELPEDHLLDLHIDRGPLDSKLIRGSIALSAFTSRKSEAPTNASAWSRTCLPENVAGCWFDVADALWREGATLAYAGSWDEESGGQWIRLFAATLQQRPVEPSRSRARRDSPAAWLDSFLIGDPDNLALSEVDSTVSPRDRTRYGLRVEIERYLTDAENEQFKDDPWVAHVIELFRLRLAVSEASVARFAVAGAIEDHEGRVPGIAEEVMLTAALGKPVYIAGGFGGAAAGVGSLLGLGHPRTGELPAGWRPHAQEERLAGIAHQLQPAPLTDLPLTLAEVASYLKKLAIGGPRWPDNGLTPDENRNLFKSNDRHGVARLVTKGLLQRFATK